MKHDITARRLREALDAAQIIPAELSERSGVSQSSISQYLSGSHAPSNISSGKMASVLGCSPVWLMGFDVSPSPGQKVMQAQQANGNRSTDTSPLILTSDEQIIVKGYRVASPERQGIILSIAREALLSKKDTLGMSGSSEDEVATA